MEGLDALIKSLSAEVEKLRTPLLSHSLNQNIDLSFISENSFINRIDNLEMCIVKLNAMCRAIMAVSFSEEQLAAYQIEVEKQISALHVKIASSNPTIQTD